MTPQITPFYLFKISKLFNHIGLFQWPWNIFPLANLILHACVPLAKPLYLALMIKFIIHVYILKIQIHILCDTLTQGRKQNVQLMELFTELNKKSDHTSMSLFFMYIGPIWTTQMLLLYNKTKWTTVWYQIISIYTDSFWVVWPITCAMQKWIKWIQKMKFVNSEYSRSYVANVIGNDRQRTNKSQP